MEISVVEERENQFFKRKDLKILIKHTGTATPSKAEIIKELAEKNSVDPSQVVINYIFTKKGIGESEGKIKILKERPPAKAEKPAEKKEENNEAQGAPGAQAAQK